MAKLVRDLIFEDMEKHGYRPAYYHVQGKELYDWLLKKLVEEANEALESGGAIDELADVFEVLRSLAEFDNAGDLDFLREVADDKAKRRGRFTKGCIWANSDDGSFEAHQARQAYAKEEAERVATGGDC